MLALAQSAPAASAARARQNPLSDREGLSYDRFCVALSSTVRRSRSTPSSLAGWSW